MRMTLPTAASPPALVLFLTAAAAAAVTLVLAHRTAIEPVTESAPLSLLAATLSPSLPVGATPPAPALDAGVDWKRVPAADEELGASIAAYGQ